MEVSLSESDIGKVEKGQIATVTVSATGKEYAARVVDVGVLSSTRVLDLDDRLVHLQRGRLPGDGAPRPRPAPTSSPA